MHNNSDVFDYIVDSLEEIKRDQKKHEQKTGELAVAMARLEERVASHRSAWGMVATVVTSALVTGLAWVFKSMLK